MSSTRMGGGGGGGGPDGLGALSVAAPLSPTSSRTCASARAIAWSEVDVIVTTAGSDLSIEMLSTPVSAIRPLIVDPLGPMILPTTLLGTAKLRIRPTPGGSRTSESPHAFRISERMCSRPSRACRSARRISSIESPSHLMSSWKAEMPTSLPATLKSIVPSASSEPRMSVKMIGSPPSPDSSRRSPIATPATRLLSGTPAARIERAPAQTEAIDEEPHDWVMSDSVRITYGNSSSPGSAARRARSARLPCPISRLPGEPIRPTSPTEKGGKAYCR
mmetsp:Transcript_35662/g.119198  ORF Transcript_35662/g.119198 Transcript_35662/m.119198 type:complete len:276 (+) Transcript_35662:482-1309(+)